MTSLNYDHLIKQMIALLGAAGLTAVAGLPVLAQVNTNNSTNNGVVNPSPGIFNEYPYNQGSSSAQSQRSVNCSAYVNGGIGGPIENGSSADSSMKRQPSQSSYDPATIPQNRSSESMTRSSDSNGMSMAGQASNSDGMSTDGQFSARNLNAAIPFRHNGPAGTSGGESNLNLQANRTGNGSSMQRSQSSFNMTTMSQNRSSDSMNQSNNSNGMRVDGQFSARNLNEAIPFRHNGPAGTSGGESNLNLQTYGTNKGSFMQSAVPSGNMTSSAYSAPNQATYSNQSAAPIPVECLPGGVNNR